jgi:Carboxypeptidase regulatory-like domain
MSPTWCRASSTRIAVAICLLFLSICRSPAQNSEVFTESLVNKRAVTATLAGTVVDERNDVVPQADVLIRDVNGTVNREVRTNQDGRFVIEVLAPRSYSVSVRHKGFRSAEIKNLNLNVHDQIALIIQLQVGSIGETVNVEANPGFLRQMGVSATGGPCSF